jgi:hypothetical protein
MAVSLGQAVCAIAQARTALCRFCWLRCLFALVFAALWSNGIAQRTDARCDPLSVAACEWSPAQARSDCTASSANFVVCSFVGGPAADDVAHHCEHVCAQLRADVFGMEKSARWQAMCRIVLHETRSSYLHAVERGGSQTIGSSTISLSGGRVTQRRIDLLAVNPEQGLAALPHELVHVLFADAFPTTAPPKWAEEGLALLMDPTDKRARHRRDLAAAFHSRSTLPLARLLVDADYPAATQRAEFYAQSLSLVEFLTQLDSPKQFLRFVKLSTEQGHDRALSAVYGMDSRELDRCWRQQASGIQLVSAESR